MPTKRHQFAKSKIALFLGWAPDPTTISGISQEKPAVVTDVGHGKLSGDVVQIADVVGMPEANGVYLIVKLSADTYALFGSDATGWGEWVSGGTSAKALFGNWCEVTNFNRQGGAKAEIIVNALCSDAEEVEMGIGGYGTVALTTNWAPDTTLQQRVDAAYDDGTIFPMQYQPIGSKILTSVLGFVQQTSESAQSGGVWIGNVNYRITGRPIRVQQLTALAA